MYCKCGGDSRITHDNRGQEQTTCVDCGREKDPNPYQLDGREIKVGDELWSVSHGWNKVEALKDDSIYLRDNLRYLRRYSLHGSYYLNEKRTLFWDEIDMTPPPPPKKKVAVYRWVFDDSLHSRMAVSAYYFQNADDFNNEYENQFAVQRIDSTKKMIDEED